MPRAPWTRRYAGPGTDGYWCAPRPPLSERVAERRPLNLRALASLIAVPLVVVPLGAQVTTERILHAEREPGNWLTYSGDYQGHRYSPLNQINTTNVARL